MSWDDPEQSLFEHELGEYHPIHAFELWASVHDYKVRPVDFQAARLDRTPYAFAEVEVEDHDLTLVAVGEGEGTRVYGRALSRAERRAQDRARRKRGRKGGANRKRR